jgi:hypothetical protein
LILMQKAHFHDQAGVASARAGAFSGFTLCGHLI